jgi:hypothetical protein
MIVARLVVVTSASVLTVHSQHLNCHLGIKADVNFDEVTTFAFVYNFNMGLHFFVYMHVVSHLVMYCTKVLMYHTITVQMYFWRA